MFQLCCTYERCAIGKQAGAIYQRGTRSTARTSVSVHKSAIGSVAGIRVAGPPLEQRQAWRLGTQAAFRGRGNT
jgi:hypothetical protein